MITNSTLKRPPEKSKEVETKGGENKVGNMRVIFLQVIALSTKRDQRTEKCCNTMFTALEYSELVEGFKK